ncbi:hypothetical protein FOA52_003085 [Chlamydomonas sp. UWO 241]|nr:hypothetical protein FOA52_003085 [Chlamydomonas sp. UWO 241]
MRSQRATTGTMSSAPVPEGNWDQYVWMVACGGLAAAFMAWGIGANDVANSFATSVGSKTLRLWQAVVIAGIFEFLGAMVLGGEVAKTVASGIADTTLYTEFPEIYMYGMLCSLTIAGTWLLFATMWCFAVSTTHSIVGAIMGFALVFGGWGGVIWFQEKGDFPYCNGFVPIILSWFFSPLIGGILSAIIFNICRYAILRRRNSTRRAIYAIPILVLFTLFINLLFVLSKGAKQDMEKRYPCSKTTGFKGLPAKDCNDLYAAASWIAAVCAFGVAVICGLIFCPLLLRKLKREADEAEHAALEVEPGASGDDAEKAAAVAVRTSAEDRMSAEDRTSSEAARHEKRGQTYESMRVHRAPDDASMLSMPWHWTQTIFSASKRQVVKGLFFDVHVGASYNAAVIAIHAAAEPFRPETEKIFSYLQVFSAACVAFAHGSNDVANAMGPFSAIYYVYEHWTVPGSSAAAPKWIFALGGAGIVIGLATYGYNIIMTIGVQMLKLTPSRGFSAELAAGLTIALASFFGIPVSTTQIIIGAETGVGLCESIHGVNWVLLGKTAIGWVLTLLLACGFCAALFSAGAYAPSIPMSQTISQYNMVLFDISDALYTDMEVLNNAQTSNTAWWSGVPAAPHPYNGSQLAVTITNQNSTYWSAVMGKSVRNAVYLNEALYYVNQTFTLDAQYSETTIGTL